MPKRIYVPEILHVVLDELKGMSPRVDSLIATTTQTSITCDTCFCSSVKEQKDDMLLLPTSKHVSSSFTKLLQTKSLSGDKNAHLIRLVPKRHAS